MYSLSGKVALVTGAAGAAGLGRAIALRLAAEGADVAVNDLHEDQSNRKGLPAVVAEIEAIGRRALPVYADVTETGDVKNMVDAVLACFGRIDILVNNAAAPPARDRVPVVELEEEAFDRVQRVDVKGVFLCSRAAARVMIASDEGGRIINIASVAGLSAIRLYAAYSTAKFAVRGFTQALALELAPQAITVNAICPGLMATERLDDQAAVLAPDGVSPEQYRRGRIDSMSAKSPFGRLTETADVANLAAFLASDQADFITGQSLVIDSGLLLT